jgi:PAT family beta-lactamase induction signal transducer AmpG
MAWAPYSYWSDAFGAAKPMMGTLFTVVFIASALFLLASRAVLADAGGWSAKLGAWMAPLLLVLFARYYLDAVAAWLPGSVDRASFVLLAKVATAVVAVLAGAVILSLRGQTWQQMQLPAEAFH